MRVHRNKPFPESFFDQSLFRIKHYFVWWCVCNELDADPDGWIRISRKDLETIFAQTQGMKPTQMTAILQTLQNTGYLQMTLETGSRWHTKSDYEIHILESAWEPKKVVKKYYPQKNTRAERRNYYRERKARLLAEAQSQT